MNDNNNDTTAAAKVAAAAAAAAATAATAAAEKANVLMATAKFTLVGVTSYELRVPSMCICLHFAAI